MNETPRETRWLDRLAAVRPDLGRMSPGNRHRKTGRFSVLVGYHPRRRFGFCVFADLRWVIREVTRLEEENENERRREIENHVGAFI